MIGTDGERESVKSMQSLQLEYDEFQKVKINMIKKISLPFFNLKIDGGYFPWCCD